MKIIGSIILGIALAVLGYHLCEFLYTTDSCIPADGGGCMEQSDFANAIIFVITLLATIGSILGAFVKRDTACLGMFGVGVIGYIGWTFGQAAWPMGALTVLIFCFLVLRAFVPDEEKKADETKQVTAVGAIAFFNPANPGSKMTVTVSFMGVETPEDEAATAPA